MKTNPLQSLWIAFCSVNITLYSCLKVFFKELTGNVTRTFVDMEIQRWVHRMFRIAKVTVKIHNPHQVIPKKHEATIIMCNHASLYDIPISFCIFPKHTLRMLAKKELSNIPLFGRTMYKAEFPFIDRKNRHQAMKDLEYAKSLMEKGIILWIAPEGTRALSGQLGPFKKGGFITAIQAKATIIPVVIRGAYNILPAKTLRYHIHQTADVYIGPPINASDYTLENKEELISRVRTSMLTLMT